MRSVTAEFASADGGQTLAPASERVLMTVTKSATNHNGGNLEFGPDGFLYLGLGDGGGSGDPQGNAQNPQRLLGKMLRIDVDTQPGGAAYGIPAGNPFAANPLCNAGGTGAQNCPEIFATGFRNPWRWSFDRQNGDLWVGDVGQGSWEEIDLVVARRQLRLGHSRRRALLRARERLPDRGPDRPGRRVRPRRSASRSRAATCTAAARRRTSRAATCSATSAA